MSELQVPKWSDELEKEWRSEWDAFRKQALANLKSHYAANPDLFIEETKNPNMAPFATLVGLYETPLGDLPTAKGIWEAFLRAAELLKKDLGPYDGERIIDLMLSQAALCALEMSGLELSEETIDGLGRIVVTTAEVFAPDIVTLRERQGGLTVMEMALPAELEASGAGWAYETLRLEDIPPSSAAPSAMEIVKKKESKALGM